MLIGGLQKLTLVDYPGRVAATVFIPGCNFFCPFCHNPELVKPEKIKKQPTISLSEFFNFLTERQTMIDGVCVTGGEPTLQDDLAEFLEKIKSLGFLIKLDTNGSRPEFLKELIGKGLIDYLAMDIKGPLENYYKIVGPGVNLESIHKSTELVRTLKDYEFRTTVVPGIHKKEDFLSIARWLEGAKKYFLQQFRPEKTLDASLAKTKPYPEEKLAEFCQVAKPYFEICEVRA